MADFYQNRVPTFPLLRRDALPALEERLERINQKRPIGVIIPALFTDLASEAMAGIIQELARARFVHRIYVSLDRAQRSQLPEARRILEQIADRTVVIWNDSPGIQELTDRIQRVLPLGPRGKGRAVWTALGYALAKGETRILAFHDADIVTYSKDLLVRLLYPVAVLGYQFSKGYYARFQDRLYGRVVRLFYFPFLRALRTLFGPLDFLDFMADFRYPLSGEFALRAEIAWDVRYPSDWGIEVGILSEIYRLVTSPGICQVEIADRYDHKHQALVAKKRHRGILRMVTDIARTFFTALGAQGLVMSDELFSTLRLTYLSNAREIVETYANLARFNQLAYDLHAEHSMVEEFARSFDIAVDEFKKYPFGSPLIPNWRRVDSAIEGALGHLVDVVEAEDPLR